METPSFIRVRLIRLINLSIIDGKKAEKGKEKRQKGRNVGYVPKSYRAKNLETKSYLLSFNRRTQNAVEYVLLENH